MRSGLGDSGGMSGSAAAGRKVGDLLGKSHRPEPWWGSCRRVVDGGKDVVWAMSWAITFLDPRFSKTSHDPIGIAGLEG